MISSRSRDIGPAALMLAVIAAGLLLYARFAHAGTDPTVAMTSAVDTSVSVWTTDGPLWLAIAAGYVALRTFLSRQHWLSQGRLLAGLTAAAGVLAAVMAWHFSGASVEGIYTALAVGVALLVHPSPVPVAAATARNPQAGTVNGYMVVSAALMTLALAVPVIAGSCTHGSTARQSAASGVVAALDCEAGNIDAQALADAKVYAEDTVQRWISGAGAKPSAEAIKAVLVRIKGDVGKCAIAGALAAATVVMTAQPGTAVSALSAGDPVQLRAAFAVAARSAGWAPVKIAGGAVL